MTRQRIREELSGRAVAAAVDLAREHGLRVDEPVVLADLFSVMVHLRPAPVVARVSTWTAKLHAPITDWLAREVAVTSYLAGQGAPVVPPSAELPPGPHERDGFGISFWTHVRAVPDRAPTAADCSAMLADLHTVLRTYPGELPLVGPAVTDIPAGLAALDGLADLLDGAERDRLRGVADRLEPLLADPGPIQPLHGDVHPNNLIVTADGPLWIDFEDVCLGPVEWDLALMSWSDPEVVPRHRPDPDRMREWSDLRAAHLALCLAAYRDDLGDLPGWDDGIRWFLDKLHPME